MAINQCCATRPHGHAEDVLRCANSALEEPARSIGQALHDEAGRILTAAHNSLAEACELAHSSVRYRLVQKSLTNIRRHARAKRVLVEVDERRSRTRRGVGDDFSGEA
jgi:signal transduction histidine kinase